ncbi:MAG: GNAT family N-acetyltransferase, partial [Caldilineaceae bacterium]|nr:GNAT family N-acetyltransferase [Caldilineaceae bacterium]
MLRATPGDQATVQGLLEHGRYTYCDFGLEDLPVILSRDLVLVAGRRDHPWGCIGIHLRERSHVLPTGAPDYGQLRCVAIDRGRHPSRGLSDLLTGLLALITPSTHPLRLVIYGSNSWLKLPFLNLGFEIVERLQFYRRHNLLQSSDRAELPPGIILRPVRSTDLEALAQLDVATFDPLWHYGVAELQSLSQQGPMQIAEANGQLLGYSALTYSPFEAQLVRLAVHPTSQGRGVGRALLGNALHAVRDLGIDELALNTQTSNTRSQTLYRSFGFRPTGTIAPV